MLNFIRRYQKFFFLFTAIITIVSFSFFGTYSTFTEGSSSAPNRDVAKAIDGSTMRERDVKGLALFMGHSPHLCDGLLEQDLLASGVLDILVERYFANLKGDLHERLEKVKTYRPYAHPSVPFLSAESVWRSFSPQLGDDLALLKSKADEETPETFILLTKLYAAQAAFPPQMLKRVLMYQQNQFSWIPQDHNLTNEDMSLFKFQSLQDWFGPQFTYILSEFLFNAAAYAEQKGYSVSKDEAYADLLQNSYRALQNSGMKEDLNMQTAETFLARELLAAGLDQPQGTQVWRKVLLFRRLFDEAGGVLLDPLVATQFSKFAGETASIELYQLPEELRLRDFRSLLKLQVYLDSVAPKTKSLNLPVNFYSVDEIEKKAPELVQNRFTIEYSHATIDDLIQDISLKETWGWELEENNFKVLRREFPALAQIPTPTREERFAQLEKLDSAVRNKVDRFAQEQMIAAHPEWIDAALKKDAPSNKTIGVRNESSIHPLEGIKDPSALYALLMAAPSQELTTYSQDGQNFYRINVIEKPKSKELLTYKEALNDGTLDTLLDIRLEAAYPDIRKREPTTFQLASGNWKPFREVKDQVGVKLYADLLKAIEQIKLKEGESLDFYAHNRLFSHVLQARLQMQQGVPDDGNIQWKLIKSQTDVARSANTRPDAFTLSEGTLSNVSNALGDIAFFQLLKVAKEEKELEANALSESRMQLSNEARRELMNRLMNTIAEKNAIDVSVLNLPVKEA